MASVVGIVVSLLISAGCMNSSADDANSGRRGSPTGDRTLSRADRLFVDNAVVSGQRELEHGTIAEAKASSDAVKEFASLLVVAHGAGNKELTSLIELKHISVTDWSQQPDRRGSIGRKDDATANTKRGGAPTGSPSTTGTTGASGTVATTGEALAREQAGMTYPWIHAAGAAFDEGFIAARIKAHQDAIALFDQQSDIGADPELKAFAQRQLPALRDHLRRAQALQQSMRQSP